ncbi:hypothetical protein [Chengkuizengella marina]|nr:hypothetical protein [Chengkuizengella marina]
MIIEGQGKVVDGERTFIVYATDKELRLLTDKPSDYTNLLKVGDAIEVSRKYELFNKIQRYGNAIINDFDALRNVFIDIGLGDVKRGDAD